MKLYLLVVLNILFAIALLGFILPWLFSATSDMAVALGVIVLCAFGASEYWMISNVIKVMTKNKNGDEE
jgi:hypothetical protein